jgi:archaellum component FlaC
MEMDSQTLSLIGKMGANLTELAIKGTATVIHGKIESVKKEKSLETVRTTYDEIVNQLLSEREDAIRIAQAYKEELERVVISDEDIKHLHNTVTKIFELLKKMSPQNETIESFEQLKELISVDTLKTMQLLGFNYKAAIGEPLTQLCGNAIGNFGNKGSKGKNNQNKNK